MLRNIPHRASSFRLRRTCLSEERRGEEEGWVRVVCDLLVCCERIERRELTKQKTDTSEAAGYDSASTFLAMCH